MEFQDEEEEEQESKQNEPGAMDYLKIKVESSGREIDEPMERDEDENEGEMKEFAFGGSSSFQQSASANIVPIRTSVSRPSNSKWSPWPKDSILEIECELQSEIGTDKKKKRGRTEVQKKRQPGHPNDIEAILDTQ